MDLLEISKRLGIEGFMHPNELEVLAELAINREVLEVGSFKGLSAFCMAITARSILCIDTFSANSAGQEQMGEITTLSDFREATSRFFNVRYLAETSEQAAREHVPEHIQFDVIFLDAMHTYEDVKADIERWWPRLRAGGVMAFHDYGHDHFPGVKRAVDERFGPTPAAAPYQDGAGGWMVTLRWVYR